ncbi:MAG TPA: S1 RNA-binding domain-containing protein [Chloroflexi bacterium]|nr:S1 RNA-binding domain-containing protein [Chloroflexota bacterium]
MGDPDQSLPETEGDSLAQLLDKYLPGSRLQRGQIVRGRVIRVLPDAIIVDVGAKCEGTVSGQELERLDPEIAAGLKPGDPVRVYVVRPDGPGGEIVLSLARAEMETDWERASSLLERGEVIELEVASANRGGLIVQMGRLRGFVPASQLSRSRRIPRMSDPACAEVLAEMVGTRLRARVIEADQDRNRLILSERAAEAQQEREKRAQVLASLREGEIRRGQVSNLTGFGAFVDLGGVDGLIHLSEICWRRVEHPSEVLRVGQEVEVTVLSVDRERQRIALSMKRLEPDPWATIGERYQVGQLVEGRITRLTKWGAFACLVGDEAIEGLIHVSELDERRVAHPKEVVQPGQVLTLRIVRVEPERHRLALSLRQVRKGEAADVDWRSEYAAARQPPPEGSLASALGGALQE